MGARAQLAVRSEHQLEDGRAELACVLSEVVPSLASRPSGGFGVEVGGIVFCSRASAWRAATQFGKQTRVFQTMCVVHVFSIACCALDSTASVATTCHSRSTAPWIALQTQQQQQQEVQPR